MKTALLVGATGLVGGYVLENLLADDFYAKVIVLTRSELNIKNTKLEAVIVDFSNLEKYADAIKADTIFCCLGTTIKTAGSQEAFKKVDYEYPLALAKIALQNGATEYLLVSALGSSKNSIVFYNRVKGEIEDAIAQLGYPSFHILQPSLIIGERKENRLGEGVAQKLSPVFDAMLFGPFSKYKSIKAEQIAKAMVQISKSEEKGIFKHDNTALLKV